MSALASRQFVTQSYINISIILFLVYISIIWSSDCLKQKIWLWFLPLLLTFFKYAFPNFQRDHSTFLSWLAYLLITAITIVHNLSLSDTKALNLNVTEFRWVQNTGCSLGVLNFLQTLGTIDSNVSQRNTVVIYWHLFHLYSVVLYCITCIQLC